MIPVMRTLLLSVLFSAILASSQSFASDYAKRMLVGQADAERLRIQHETNLPYTLNHLQEAPDMKGKTILEIGCGAGNMLKIFSDMVGNEGKVIALDSNNEQLLVAKAFAEQHALSNVIFVQEDISLTSILSTLSNERIDLIFTRFVLMHIAQQKEAVDNIYRLLVDGGMWFSEETVTDLSSSSHFPHIFEEYKEFFRQKYILDGLNPNTYAVLRNLSMEGGFTFVNEIIQKKPVAVEDFKTSVRNLEPLLQKMATVKTADGTPLMTIAQIDQWKEAANNMPEDAEIYINGLSCLTVKK